MLSQVKPKTILVSHFPLPYNGIGSWTNRFGKYLATEHNEIDYIICPKVESPLPQITYYFSNSQEIFKKIKEKLYKSKNRYYTILKAIEKILKQDASPMVIQLIDNPGIAMPLDKMLRLKKYRHRVHLQLFYHGYAPYYGNPKGQKLFSSIDELILLTKDSYRAHLEYYNQITCMVTVLGNAIDKNIFKKINHLEKENLRVSFNVKKETCIFLWLSQDRPKKGLDFIVQIWDQFIDKHPKSELWIIGSNRKFKTESIKTLGKIENTKLSQYYQMADIYLFPTLCKEGFGLSLAEAVASGCYAIASKIGGVSEVLNYGNYGVLIENPNFQDEWLKEMDNAYRCHENKNLDNYFKIPENLYSLEQWVIDLKKIINRSKKIALKKS